MFFWGVVMLRFNIDISTKPPKEKLKLKTKMRKNITSSSSGEVAVGSK